MQVVPTVITRLEEDLDTNLAEIDDIICVIRVALLGLETKLPSRVGDLDGVLNVVGLCLNQIIESGQQDVGREAVGHGVSVALVRVPRPLL